VTGVQVSDGRIERIAFDIGGTFTDVVVLWADGRLQTAKILSLLETVGRDIRVKLDIEDAPVGSFIHGTTVAANALLENKLARIGLITTAGFRDALEMRSQRRPNVYDINWDRPPPLVPREWRLELKERILADGRIDAPLDAAEARAAVDALAAAGVEALAVCLVNSYVNDAHERKVAALVRALDPPLPVSVSSEEFAEAREYERTSTTAVNAALMPVVDRYLTRLESQLGVGARELLIMQSNGGLMTSAVARRRPVQMVESGPAAGVLAAARLAREAGLAQVLAFDMGGTTAKASLIENGVPLEKPGGEVGGGANLASRFFGGSGHAVRVPALDIAEVGSGGGSIAWIDPGGALRVGPEGAGADPGPVCYGRGGDRPTVTDANVLLGYVNPVGLAGATVGIDRDLAADAMRRRIAEPLGLSVLDAAYGIVRVANATTMRALRSVSIERGMDPRRMVLLAFGGSGPVHAASLAADMGIPQVYVPPFPGIFSAVGLLLADYRHDTVRGVHFPLERLDEAALAAQLRELELAARATLVGQGIAADAIDLLLEADVQYKGQDMSLSLAIPPAGPDLGPRLHAAFGEAHRAAFGYKRDVASEIVSLRVRATARASETRIGDMARGASHLKSAVRQPSARGRQAYFGAAAGTRETAVVGRPDLDATPRRGPLIVEEWDTSVVVPPGWTARRDDAGNIVLDREEGDAP
jgi:N-methylhydantoinase A